MNLKSFLFVIMFLSCVTPLYQISQLKDQSLEKILQNPQVYVKVTTKDLEALPLKRNLYAIKIFARNKKQAYKSLEQKFQRVFTTLKNCKLIPNDLFCISSKLNRKYLKNKRVWLFERIFIVEGISKQVDEANFNLLQQGAIKLSEGIDQQILGQNIKIIKLYLWARIKLNSALLSFPQLQISNSKIIKINNEKTQQFIKQSNDYEEQDSSDEKIIVQRYYGKEEQGSLMNQQKFNQYLSKKCDLKSQKKGQIAKILSQKKQNEIMIQMVFNLELQNRNDKGVEFY